MLGMEGVLQGGGGGKDDRTRRVNLGCCCWGSGVVKRSTEGVSVVVSPSVPSRSAPASVLSVPSSFCGVRRRGAACVHEVTRHVGFTSEGREEHVMQE